MAAITPQTDVYLLKVPLEIDNENQLTFANATAQFNYFNGLTGKIALDNFTYQRKDGVIRVPYNIDDIIEYNYVMYRNDGFSNKWFYAYISGMEFINPSTTAVSIKTDTFQTWQFDLTYKQCFVEREHVNDDTVGLHTQPENLETGEYLVQGIFNIPMYENPSSGNYYDAWWVCFCVSEYPDDTTFINGEGITIGGVYSAMHFICEEQRHARDIMEIYSLAGKAEAIKNMYMVPQCVVNVDPTKLNPTLSDGTTPASMIEGSNGQTTKIHTVFPLKDSYTAPAYHIPQPTDLAGSYQPVNNKLKTYPYTYFYLTNNSGEQAEYHWEDFPFETYGTTPNTYEARSCAFKKCYVPSASLSAKLYFTNYKGYVESGSPSYGEHTYSYGLNFSKIPVCAWTTDYYTNWLTQNGVNINTQIALGAAGAAAGLFTGGVGLVAGTAGLIGTIANNMAKVHQAKIFPDQAGGDINAGDFTFAYLKSSISFYYMSIRPEYAALIDKYFSAYGYKVNTIKIPNVTGRTNWNYVKTVGCYIEANIPQEDLQEIKNLFDKGITFWHNPATFADYSQNNDIV